MAWGGFKASWEKYGGEDDFHSVGLNETDRRFAGANRSRHPSAGVRGVSGQDQSGFIAPGP
ncbi:hypothetical protein WCLP8_3310003 [uncultured Gammaproteobacteria bacterium]